MTIRGRGAFLFAAALALAAMSFAALGIWQIARRTAKLALIQRVEARIQAAPSPFPRPDEWPAIDAAGAEYRRISAEGTFLPVRPAFVQAVTARGAGFWVLAPFRLEDGTTVLVNRGFVRPEERAEQAVPAGRRRVAGLLRLPEPVGGFLRANAPEADRWYSRDPAAIAAARGLGPVAPYFVDAERDGDVPPGEPEPGLTVVAFRNEHAVYAATWFALALLSLGGIAAVLRVPGTGRPQNW